MIWNFSLKPTNRRAKNRLRLTLSSNFGKVFLLVLLVLPFFSLAAFNKQINYQGKLTETDGSVVSDGSYNFRFKLYTSASGGSPVWTETRTDANQVTVSSGLFSVLLGSVSSLDGVDFDQPLYLSVEVGGTAAVPNWDGEMTPRRILGAVPSAIEAGNSRTLSGLATTSFLRSDTTNSTGTISSLNVSSLNGGEATFTQATTTNLFTDLVRSLSAIFTDLIATNATTTNATTTNLAVTGSLDTVSLNSTGMVRGNYFHADSTSQASSLPYASTTALSVSGSSYLGTVVSGTWNGGIIGDAYLDDNLTVNLASNSTLFGGLATTSFLRSDTVGTLSAGSSASLLTLNQTGTGPLLDLQSSGSTVFALSNLGVITSGTWQGTALTDAYVSDSITAANYIPLSQKGAASGVATLNALGKVPTSQLTPFVLTETFVVASQVEMLALSTAEMGDVAVRTDLNKSFILRDAPPSTLDNWVEMLTPTDNVLSVNGQTGSVYLDTDDVAEGSTNLYFTNARVDDRINLQKAQPGGLASLGADGKIPTSQIGSLFINNTFVVADNTAMLALSAEKGDLAVVTGTSKTFVLKETDPSQLANWVEISSAAGVLSVNGQSGAVTLTSSDIAEGTNLYFTEARARAALSVASDPLFYDSSTGVISLVSASSTADGYLKAADWITFNSKQSAITGAASSILSSDLDASLALVSTAGGKVGVSAVTATELGYLSGVSSALQTQLNARVQGAGSGVTGGLSTWTDANTLGVTFTPTVSYLTATNTTATTTLAGGLRVGGTSGLSVLQNGRIGIGTPSPFGRLQVGSISDAVDYAVSDNGILFGGQSSQALFAVENSYTSGLSGGAGIVAYSNDGSAVITGDRLGYLMFGGSKSASAIDHAVGIVGYAGSNWTTGSTEGYLSFETTPSGVAANLGDNRVERMRITGSGYVGIGTTTPTLPLVVSGAIQTTGGIYSGSAVDNGGTGGIGLRGTNWAGSGWEIFHNASAVDDYGLDFIRGSYSYLNLGYVASTTYFNLNKADINTVFRGVGDSALLVTDASVDRVGIGTSAPNSKLEVVSAAGADVRVSTNQTYPFIISDNSKTQTIITKSGDGSTGNVLMDFNVAPTGGTSTAYFRFFRSTNTTGVKKLEFYKGDNSGTVHNVIGVDGTASYFQVGGGNFGIGTTSPYAKLSVAGEVLGEYFTATNTSATSTLAGGLSVAGTGGLTVLQNGHVGIGTTSPLGVLDVKGSSVGGNVDIYLRNQTDNTSNGRVNLRMPIYNGSSGLVITQMVASLAGLNKGSGSYDAAIYTGQSTSNLHFAAGNTGYSDGVHMTLTSGGNLGIGTTSPLSTLSVVGDALIKSSGTASLGLENGSGKFWSLESNAETATQGNFVIRENRSGSHRFTIMPGGSVGMGTNTPAYELQVVQNGATADFAVNRYGGGGVWLAGDTGHGYVSSFKTGGNLYLRTGGTNTRITLNDATGNVGIGTTTPDKALTVGGSSMSLGTYNVNSDSVFNFTTIGSKDSRINFYEGSDTVGGYLSYTGSASLPSLQLGTRVSGVDYPALYMTRGTGYVGIGTSTPYKLFSVAGDIKSTGSIDTDVQFLGQSADTVSSPSFSWTGDTNVGLYRPAADTLGFVTNGGERLRITSGGNVGIGTTSPYAKLSVVGTVVASNFIGTTTATSTLAGGINITSGCFSVNGTCVGGSGSGSGTVNSGTAGQLAYYDVDGTAVLGTSTLSITSAGNIGIATTTQEFPLIVNKDTGGNYSRNTISALFGDQFDGDNVYLIGNSINTGFGATGDSSTLWLNYLGYLGGNTKYRDVAIGNGRGGAAILSVDGSAGNVGIGTTSPYAKLSVVGTVVAANFVGTTTATSTLAGGINITSGCFSVNGTCVGGSGSGSGTVNSGTAGQLAYYDVDGTAVSGTSTIFVSTAGNVGIGTTSPAYKLQIGSAPGVIAGQVPMVSIKNTNTSNTYDQALWVENSSTAAWTLAAKGPWGIRTQGTSASYFSFMADGGRVRITLPTETDATDKLLVGVDSTGELEWSGTLKWDSANNILGIATTTNRGTFLSTYINGGNPSSSVHGLVDYATSTYISSGDASTLSTGRSGRNTYISVGGDAGCFVNCQSGGAGGDVFIANGGAPGDSAEGSAGAGGTITMAAGGNNVGGTYGVDGTVNIGNSAATAQRNANLKVYGYITMSRLTTNGAVYSNGGLLTNTNPSSQAYKHNIQETDLNTDALLGLKVKSFVWNESGVSDFGLIAEEVRGSLPELYVDDGMTKGYKLDHLPFYLLQLAQKQQGLIESLDEKITKLDSQIQGGSINSNNLWTLDSLSGHIKAFSTLDLNNLSIENIKALKSFTGSWSLDEEGRLTIKGLEVSDYLKVGSPSKRTGITLFDEQTGAPYCLSISGGVVKTVSGECGQANVDNNIVSPAPSSTSTVVIGGNIATTTGTTSDTVISGTPIQENSPVGNQESGGGSSAQEILQSESNSQETNSGDTGSGDSEEAPPAADPQSSPSNDNSAEGTPVDPVS